MNSMRSYPNLRFLTSARPAIASNRKSQTSLLGVLALCMAMLVGSTPVYPATRTAKAAPPTSNGVKMAPTETEEEAAALHHTLQIGSLIPGGEDATEITGTGAVKPPYHYGYFTAYPYTWRFLVAYFAYDPYNCKEVAAGTWYPDAPFPSYYGRETEGYVSIILTSGPCVGYTYTAQGIYYEWIHGTGAYRNDRFGAIWRGGGLNHRWVFYMLDR